MNFHKLFCLIIMLSLLGHLLYAQDDLLEEIEWTEKSEKTNISAAFKALQVINLPSTKMPYSKELYFVVSHRFGSIGDGFETFYGLDNANTKIGLIYGIKDWLAVGISRTTYQKTFEGTVKYRIFTQGVNDAPVTIVGYNVIGINTDWDKDDYPGLKFKNRLNYVSQLLISRKITPRFSLQILPSLIHKNTINDLEKQNQFSFGTSGRFKVTKRVSCNFEYFYNFDKPESEIYKNNVVSIGADIETGGHVFQLMLSNSQATSEAAYITNATGEWFKDIYFGFNIYRVF